MAFSVTIVTMNIVQPITMNQEIQIDDILCMLHVPKRKENLGKVFYE